MDFLVILFPEFLECRKILLDAVLHGSLHGLDQHDAVHILILIFLSYGAIPLASAVAYIPCVLLAESRIQLARLNTS